MGKGKVEATGKRQKAKGKVEANGKRQSEEGVERKANDLEKSRIG